MDINEYRELQAEYRALKSSHAALLEVLELSINTMNAATWFDKQDNSGIKYAVEKAKAAIAKAKAEQNFFDYKNQERQ